MLCTNGINQLFTQKLFYLGWSLASCGELQQVQCHRNNCVYFILLCVLAGWIIANSDLSMTVSYPLVSSVSGLCCHIL